MAEPTPGRPGQTGNAAPAGPRSATAATFQVNDKSLKDLHTTWRTLILDVRDFNKALKDLETGGRSVDIISAKLGKLGLGRLGGGGIATGGRLPGMPDIPALGSGRTGAQAHSVPGPGGHEYPPGTVAEPAAPAATGGTPALAGGSSPWKKRALEGALGVAGATSLFYARRMNDISDADLFFNQQAQNTGYGYAHAEKNAARNALVGLPGGAGFGGGVRGYQSVQDLLGGARNVFSATGGTTGGRGMAQLRAAGQLASLTPDLGLTGAGAAVAGLYDPTTSARMASVGIGPSIGMRGQLQTPQAIYQHIVQAVYGGRRPTAQMITQGMQPGANLYMTLTQGLGLPPETIEQFTRYAIAQANLGGNAGLTNRAIDAASRGQSGGHLTKQDRALIHRAGLNDSIRAGQNELGGAQTRQTIEAGREAEDTLRTGFSELAETTDKLTNTFKRLNDVTGGWSGKGFGAAALGSGAVNAAFNAVGGVGGGMFAYQAVRQMMGKGARGAGGVAGDVAGAAEGAASEVGGAAARAAGIGGFLGKWGTRLAKLPLPALGSHVYTPDPATTLHRGRDGHMYTHDGRRVDGTHITNDVNPDEVRTTAQDTHRPTSAAQDALGFLRRHFAAGGVVPGNHNRDDVDIKATPGEVVVPKGVVRQHGGADTLMRLLGFEGRGRNGHYADGGEVTGKTEGLNATFLGRLKAWAAAEGANFNIVSGYRSYAKQQELYNGWISHKPGYNLAAKPGQSNHEYGLAADGPPWGNRHPERFGLRYAVEGENWHVEPVNAKAMRGGAAMATGSNSQGNVASSSQSDPAAPSTAPNYVTAPPAAADERSAYAAWLANSVPAYGVNNAPSAVATPSPKASGVDATQPAATSYTTPSNPTGNVKLGQQRAAARGWTGSEWDALYNLFEKESGWRTDAANSTSSARGIAQTMMSVHFGKDWKTSKDALDFVRNPTRQIDWGLNYIAQRYTTPSKAWAHSQQFNWYDTGAWQTGNETAVLHKDEMVVPAGHARKLRSLLEQRRNQASMPQSAPTAIRERGNVSVSISMPVQLLGRATHDDAVHLVQMVKTTMQEDEELAKMGSG